MYGEYPASFRDRLLDVNGLAPYRVSDPRQLNPELRTCRWQQLCDHLDAYAGLPPRTQSRVLRLLTKLGLHSCVLELAPETTAAEEMSASVQAAEFGYCRALASFLVAVDEGVAWDPQPFETIARHAPAGSPVRIRALNHLVVQHAKKGADVATVEHWLTRHRDEIEQARASLGEVNYVQQTSRHHRAAGFLPQMRGDRDGVVREMDHAETYAEKMPRDTPEMVVVADELMFACLESRIKEALWLGDLHLAESRARRLVTLDPLDPVTHCHLGLVLLEQGRVPEALVAYLAAARVPTAKAAEAWFMAGQCYEELEQASPACDAYLISLHLDPLGIAAAERLVDVSTPVHIALTTWAETRLARLRDLQQAAISPHQPAPYQQYPARVEAADTRRSPGHRPAASHRAPA
jgi:tetratricopeptide (TPR) repeat protein